tara:strand:- start:15 stop:389 length:375 start_codon:yes stop_codon:yes gene_type:complete
MQSGNIVDVMIGVQPRTKWEYGWTIDRIFGEWALISKYEGGLAPYTRRKKVEVCRLRKPCPFLHLKGTRLPEVGAGVMYRVPKDSINQEWKFGVVLKRNKKSIKVLHDNKVISRTFDHFIEVAG